MRPKLLGVEKYFLTSAAFLVRKLVWRKILTRMFFLTNVVTHFQLCSATYIEYGKCKRTQYFIDKAILGKMCGVYVTYMANVDKG